MEEEGILFSFSGLISQSLTSFTIKSVQEQLEEFNIDHKIIKTMFLITIEQLQNVMSYSKNRLINDGNKFISPGIFVIGFDQKNKKYYVSSSNEIEEDDKEKISKKIDLINSMENKQLRDYLREQLRTAENKHERGAGVGFVEMAKRSSEKLEYHFENIDGKTYFHIITYI